MFAGSFKNDHNEAVCLETFKDFLSFSELHKNVPKFDANTLSNSSIKKSSLNSKDHWKLSQSYEKNF